MLIIFSTLIFMSLKLGCERAVRRTWLRRNNDSQNEIPFLGDMAPVIFPEMSPPLLRFPRTFPPSSRVGPTQGFSEPQAPTVLHLLPAIWIGMAQMLWRNSKNVKWSHVFLFVLGHLHDHWTKLGGEQHAVPFRGWTFACAWHIHCPFRDYYTFHVLDLMLVRCAEAVLSWRN